MAYYTHGASLIERDPSRAAASFYWASRLRPGWAAAMQGEYVARLRAFPNRRQAIEYRYGSRAALRVPAISAMDSVGRLARAVDPFSSLLFGDLLIVGRPEGIGADWRSIGDQLSGIASAADGDYERALVWFGHALNLARYKADLHVAIAQVYYEQGRMELARASFESARAATEAQDTAAERLVVLYRPKAHIEYSLGIVNLALHDTTAAREAFGRALQEDLAFYSAHVRLSALALAAGDSASAISEMDLAVQIRPDQPALHMRYGMILADAQRYDEALREFRKANELNPDYAEPYFVIARMYDGSDMYAEALEQYHAFAAHASRDHPQLEPVRARMAQIQALLAERAAAAAAPTPPTP
ncbi:MAG TPA: tetratricopeptide repeat protein [Longimicrobiaceae bacterium]|nr:tetratricopeptide repeat protein [Longimicrobiaceae bacterium]